MKRNRFSTTSCKFRIGANIRKWRNIKDIKQKDLADALQLSESAMSNIENDLTNITIAQLEEISIALNVSLEQLVSDPQEKFRTIHSLSNAAFDNSEQELINRELLTAIISSMEKRDQQLQVIMQNFIHTMSRLMPPENILFNTSKKVSSRA